MWSLYTVVTLCSVLQPRYVAFQQSFIPWCGFPESSSKGHKGRLFCVCKTPLPLLSMPLSALQISPSFSSVYVCVTGEKDGWGVVWGIRQQKIPNTCPGIPGMLSESTHVHILIKQRCGPTLLQLVCSHACTDVSPCAFSFIKRWTHSYVTVCK